MNFALLAFVLRNLKTSFRNEAMSHLLTLSTVCISLCLISTIILLERNLLNWAQEWLGNQAIAVFVAPTVDEASRSNIEEFASSELGLKNMRWQSPENSATTLKSLLGTSTTSNLTAFAPWVLEATKGTAIKPEALKELTTMKHVLHIDEGTVVAQKVETLAQNLRRFGSAIIILLLLAAFLVVSSTVGLALNARRDEVEIMDLVGTPIGWIYTAYVSEGIVIGLIGSLLAVILVELPLRLGLQTWLVTFGLPHWQSFQTTGIIFILTLGGVIGALGSYLSVRRFLRHAWQS